MARLVTIVLGQVLGIVFLLLCHFVLTGVVLPHVVRGWLEDTRVGWEWRDGLTLLLLVGVLVGGYVLGGIVGEMVYEKRPIWTEAVRRLLARSFASLVGALGAFALAEAVVARMDHLPTNTSFVDEPDRAWLALPILVTGSCVGYGVALCLHRCDRGGKENRNLR